MNNGKLYGVGVGPGDKELLTLKAIRVLRESEVTAVPVMSGGNRAAYEIVEEYVRDKDILELPMPMTKDFARLEASYTAIAQRLEGILKEGKSIAFITLGDVTIYSTYARINRIVQKHGFETELVPGITSFCAAAARLNMPLCERGEPLIILPASYEQTENMLNARGTKVLMKAGRRIGEVCDLLRGKGLAEKSVMVECCGMENERIYKGLDDVGENSSYFSIVIVKD